MQEFLGELVALINGTEKDGYFTIGLYSKDGEWARNIISDLQRRRDTRGYYLWALGSRNKQL